MGSPFKALPRRDPSHELDHGIVTREGDFRTVLNVPDGGRLCVMIVAPDMH